MDLIGFPLIDLQAEDAMHRSNNAVIMQTKQLGRIEALEEELHSSRAKMAELEVKTMSHTDIELSSFNIISSKKHRVL